MADPLSNIPFYGAYAAKRQMNENEGLQEMKTLGALMQLKDQFEQHQQNAQMRSALSGGVSIEQALEAALKTGNLGLAAKLSPIVEARRKGQPIGSGGLLMPDNTVVPPVQRPAQPPQLVQLITAHDAMPDTDPNKKILKKAIEKLSTHQAPVNVYSGSLTPGVDEAGNPVFVQPSAQPGVEPRVVKGVKPPPKGADAGQSPENAGKIAMSQQAIDGIGTVRGAIFDKDGKLNRSLVAQMNFPVVAGMPGNTNARIARSAIRNAVEAKLRVETGAAATESEVERTLARFLPTVADTDASAKFKLDELEKFFKTSLSMTKGVKTPEAQNNDPLGLR